MIMEIEIDFTKSAQENANDYYKKSKKLALKKEGAEKAIKDLEKKLKEERANATKAPRAKDGKDTKEGMVREVPLVLHK